jgi:hypothetical protein
MRADQAIALGAFAALLIIMIVAAWFGWDRWQ